jgi:hypothetical protein
MALHQGTMKLTPQQANVIPAGKYIYTDETFLVKQPIASVEAFPRQGKELSTCLLFISKHRDKISHQSINPHQV